MSLSSEKLINLLAAVRNWQSTIENSPPEEAQVLLKFIEEANGAPALNAEEIEEICDHLKNEILSSMSIPMTHIPARAEIQHNNFTVH